MRPGTRLSTANPTKVRGPTHSTTLASRVTRPALSIATRPTISGSVHAETDRPMPPTTAVRLRGTSRQRSGTCTTIANRAPAPNGLRVTSKGQTIVSLAWDTVTDATLYQAERNTSSSGPWSTVRFEHRLTYRNDDRGPTCGTTYYYRVRARETARLYRPTTAIRRATLP